ncbi:MAG: phospho-sugar mutase [Firmicutes bacterium]|nr:phospho-sugar mutase [Bacillota bacterium]
MEKYITDAYERWCASPSVDEQTKAELAAIAGNEDEIKSRFVSYLSFGTGGLRGHMAAGTNRMNVYTVAHATQGLAELILSEGCEARGVAVACDSRNNSERFSKTAAEVLAGNGIKVYIYDSLRPTPMLSFAVRYHGCIAGINITASHNPKEYNGYKAYWEDGAQLAPEQAAVVSESMSRVDIFDGVKRLDFDRGVEDGIITVIRKETDDAYVKCVLAEAVNPDAVKAEAENLKIVYTPLFGAGYKMVPRVLTEIGVKHLYPVEFESIPNGDFPGLKNPNPEFKEAFTRGLMLADKVGSNLIIATDPDSDRVGVMAKSASGEFVTITGNQMGALLLDYIIAAYRERGTMPPEPYAVKTIVTTEMASKICEEGGVALYNVLTGFKFIGEVIKQHEAAGHGTYIFGFEESYGYLKGTYARDKDAVVASMLITEMAAYYSAKGMTLADALASLYERYGCYREVTKSIMMEGLDGAEKIKGLMNKLRKTPPAEFAGRSVTHVRDYLARTITETATGNVSDTGLPESDVMYFSIEGGDVIVCRPSGTEPKIKLYFLAGDVSAEAADEKIEAYQKSLYSFLGV